VNQVAWAGLLSMVVSLVGILLAWYALQAIRWDLFVKNVKDRSFQLLLVLLSLTLGHAFARFVMDYLNWSTLLRYLF